MNSECLGSVNPSSPTSMVRIRPFPPVAENEPFWLVFSYEKSGALMGCFPLFTGQTKTRDLKNRGFARTCKVGFQKVVLTFVG